MRLLLDPKAKIEMLADTTVTGKPVIGLRVMETTADSIDLYFDPETKRLIALDYTDTRHVFSEWKSSTEGHNYPSHVSGYRFVDKAAKTVKETQWYQTDILELTPLAELPAELK